MITVRQVVLKVKKVLCEIYSEKRYEPPTPPPQKNIYSKLLC